MAKKATAKTTAKKTAVKKPTAKTTREKALTAKFPADTSRGGMDATVARQRRPPNNSNIPMDYLEDMETSFASWRGELEDFSAHLRALDRRWLNGVGVRKLGFIGRTLMLAAENPEFL